MRDHVHYRRQAEGCRRLLADVADLELAGAIRALAHRYDVLAAFWSAELVIGA